MGEERSARRYLVSGMVQGVGYRYYAQRTAQQLGLAGYVKNLRDGRVEVYAIGAPDSFAALKAALERGPQFARVSGVSEEQDQLDPRFANEFSIEYDE